MTRSEIQAALAAPFKPSELGHKPQTVSGHRALVVWYVDARAVMNRLDSVLGLGRWQTTYREMGTGVVCSLRVCVEGEWTVHEDTGSQSDQKDEGDQQKSAFSDALKRAAVHVGVARYLYDLPLTWADYDPVKKQFVREPVLPAWALPADANKQPAAEQPAPQAKQPAEELASNDQRQAIVAELKRTGRTHLQLLAKLKLPVGTYLTVAQASMALKLLADMPDASAPAQAGEKAGVP